MNNDVPYFEDGTTRILRYLQGSLGDNFKAYMEGDPVAIPQSLMPCICVFKMSGSTRPSATGTNDVFETVQIRVVLNKKDDYGSNASLQNVDLTERKLRHLVAGRDPATAAYLPESIFGILSTNITLGDQVLSMDLQDEYGEQIRPNPAGDAAKENAITSEAWITVALKMRVVVIPRS